ncbi:Two-component response regulator, PleD family, consists of two REC domains and a diguanylate cyclase (GGDEF) domain [Dyadobacter soli]|uniref:Two-component response regulator, PleD family, consists of two REC domains and a diguanylate cyclase (GGDEF) domain n=1 Tax=Dyadobacter soli TaxID=659014 RepID=A0A1G7D0W2_9BACT|nr:response regulator [Dyadobacter soli]SDE45169.1 Two-component response regulator, PleD family, consists of two REC domains and a diguanylate cyclase (GGDEF) domain [Dyadobacter soli]
MKTIYLADDDEDDRMLIRAAVEQVISPVRIIELDSGDDLIKLINNQGISDDPSVIIMDMNMPRLSGLETLGILKMNDASRHIPVVMLSTTSNRSLVREAYERGVNAFLEKPVHEADFVKLAKAVDACFMNASHDTDETPVQPDWTKGSVIVIEDNEDHMFFIRNALQDSMPGVQVVEFATAAAVDEQLRAVWDSIVPAPHLILMDLYLPGRQDGLDLLANIHQLLINKDCRSIPVIVFSYSDKPEDMHASYQRNANAYMTKGKNASLWKNDFKNLRNFWWNTVSTPDPR